jgi:ketosteroid isomerase-like protein
MYIKNLSKSILGIALILCTSAFAQKNDQQFIRDFTKDYTGMYTEMDFSNVKEYYSDSIRVMPEFQKTILSLENAEKYYKAFFNRFKIKSYTRNIDEILDLDSKLMEIGTFDMSMSDSIKTYELKGKYANIWKKDSTGNPKLLTEAWNYDHNVEFEQRLKFDNVPSITMALEAHVPITDNISFELAGLNSLMEKIISQKDGNLWTKFYDDNGKSLHSFKPMIIGRKKLDEYYLEHAEELPVFEKLDIRTDKIEELNGYVLEYATAIANWRMNEYSGVSTSKNIRLWKRQPNGSLKIYRLIAMYDR